MSECTRQSQDEAEKVSFTLFSASSCTWTFSGFGYTYLHWGGLPSKVSSAANLLQKQSHKHTRKQCFPVNWGLLAQEG